MGGWLEGFVAFLCVRSSDGGVLELEESNLVHGVDRWGVSHCHVGNDRLRVGAVVVVVGG
jgi:hypothetical protein